MAVKSKGRGLGLEMRTFVGSSENTYLVFKSGDGAFHTFVEVEAKQAARDSGATIEANTRQMWQEVWDKK